MWITSKGAISHTCLTHNTSLYLTTHPTSHTRHAIWQLTQLHISFLWHSQISWTFFWHYCITRFIARRKKRMINHPFITSLDGWGEWMIAFSLCIKIISICLINKVLSWSPLDYAIQLEYPSLSWIKVYIWYDIFTFKSHVLSQMWNQLDWLLFVPSAFPTQSSQINTSPNLELVT
jgi:hypothetical protein